MNSEFMYLPPEKRKKILLITDDIRVHSGVATVGREVVLHTAQHFIIIFYFPSSMKYYTRLLLS